MSAKLDPDELMDRPTSRSCLDCGIGEACYCATPREARQTKSEEKFGFYGADPQPAGPPWRAIAFAMTARAAFTIGTISIDLLANGTARVTLYVKIRGVQHGISHEFDERPPVEPDEVLLRIWQERLDSAVSRPER